MDESPTAVFMRPTNPGIAGRKVEDRVSYSKKPDEAPILTISNKESKAAAKAL